MRTPGTDSPGTRRDNRETPAPNRPRPTARLSGWVHAKRDHGGLLFIDLRDHFGLTQIVVGPGSPAFETLDRARLESVVTVTGETLVSTNAMPFKY